jgi:hypothetical protein
LPSGRGREIKKPDTTLRHIRAALISFACRKGIALSEFQLNKKAPALASQSGARKKKL